ncbi:ImmA/IrrE family metallo-endopeptidase [Bosea sp. (in: a-proteobacteria)]|jgi:HTH-type transcriptional regulator/antitoxin HigA|uniref:ImmA/IrrE family metallo-endopeptidase n=1 Tax=Bosea sp. (in: a-proteobacteria) TaxID=1871050 RepID=UPI003F6FA0D6
MTVAAHFQPDWAVAPGATIRDMLSARRLTSDDLCAATDLSIDQADNLLSGKLPISEPLAEMLAEAVGGSRQFWLKRESLYRFRLSQIRADQNESAQTNFFKQLPLRDMKAFGWLDPYAGMSRENAILAFFRDSGGDWQSNGLGMANAVAFRMSTAHETNPAAVAAWLRQGVIESDGVPCAPWDRDALLAAIPNIRTLTRLKDPQKFFACLVQIGRQCGVAFVFARTPKGCSASGATHFVSKTKAVVQLSFRYRSDDHFWFTLFHEIGHLILHGESHLFLEGASQIASHDEAEANEFAANTLVPPDARNEFIHIRQKFSLVMRFAKRVGVSPGIVVGQMQKAGILRHDQMNFLKIRYNWHQFEELSSKR